MSPNDRVKYRLRMAGEYCQPKEKRLVLVFSLLRKRPNLTAAVQAALDLACIAGAYAIAAYVTTPPDVAYTERLVDEWPFILVFAAFWCAVCVDRGLFFVGQNESIVTFLFNLARAFATTVLGSAFVLSLLLLHQFDRWLFTYMCVAAFVIVHYARLIVGLSIRNLRTRGYTTRRIVIVGANERTVHLVKVLMANEQYGYAVIGFLEDDESRRPILENLSIPFSGPIASLEHLLKDEVVDAVYISLPLRSHYEGILRVAHLCEGVGVPVRFLADFFPLRIANNLIVNLGGAPLISLDLGSDIRPRFALSRMLDSVVALVLIVLLSPILLATALVVRIASGGPILVRGRTADPGGSTYSLYSFRVEGVDRAQPGDQRATFIIGRVLRTSGFEELPHLFGVLTGRLNLSSPPARHEADESLHATDTRQSTRAASKPAAETGRSWLMLAIADSCCVFLAYLIAVRMVSPLADSLSFNVVDHLPYFFILLFVWFGAAVEQRLWTSRIEESTGDYLGAVFKAVCNATVICVFFMAMLTPDHLAVDFLVRFSLLSLGLLLLFRTVLRKFVARSYQLGYGERRSLMIGANARAAALSYIITRHREYGLSLVGVLEDDQTRADDAFGDEFDYLGAIDNLETMIDKLEVSEVYVALPVRSHYEAIQHIAAVCHRRGVQAHLLADFFPVRIAQSRPMYIEDIPLLSLSTIPEAYGKVALKRLVDFVGSTILILAFSPLLLLVAALVKLTSKGPVIFPQERVGQNQRRFKMLKFRSMVHNAEALRAELEAQNEADGPVFKIKNDPRITPIGAFIRRYSIDELPQLFNVWWGQMSLVGPRPPIPSEVEDYSWDQRRRLSVKPGMTGLWQVSGRSEVAFNEWVEMDLFYIDNWSLAGDFVILLRTIRAVLNGRGAA